MKGKVVQDGRGLVNDLTICLAAKRRWKLFRVLAPTRFNMSADSLRQRRDNCTEGTLVVNTHFSR